MNSAPAPNGKLDVDVFNRGIMHSSQAPGFRLQSSFKYSAENGRANGTPPFSALYFVAADLGFCCSSAEFQSFRLQTTRRLHQGRKQSVRPCKDHARILRYPPETATGNTRRSFSRIGSGRLLQIANQKLSKIAGHNPAERME